MRPVEAKSRALWRERSVGEAMIPAVASGDGIAWTARAAYIICEPRIHNAT